MKEVLTVIAAIHHYLQQTNKWCFYIDTVIGCIDIIYCDISIYWYIVTALLNTLPFSIIMSHSHILPTLDEDQVVVLKASFFLILILQRIGPQKVDGGLIEIFGFWSSTFVSCQYCDRVHSMTLSGGNQRVLILCLIFHEPSEC